MAVSPLLCTAEQLSELARWFAEQLGVPQLDILETRKLSGGAIQQNWLITLSTEQDGQKQTDSEPSRHDGSRYVLPRYVLRCDAPSQLGVSHPKSAEAALLSAAAEMGVLVPQIIGICADETLIGKPFFVMSHIPGEAQARKWVRHPQKAEFATALAGQLGQQMATLHQIPPDNPHLGFLSRPDTSAEEQALAEIRAILDKMDTPHPVLEFACHWLKERMQDWQDGSEMVLCHRDFRAGNFLIHDGQMTALLDWEFARFSVPAEDIGWLCARCWRFGADHLAVGGLADYRDFHAGYVAAGGTPPALRTIRYWQIFAELRWAAIALEQAWRCQVAGELSLELVLSAPLVAEMEYHLLTLISEMDTLSYDAQQVVFEQRGLI